MGKSQRDEWGDIRKNLSQKLSQKHKQENKTKTGGGACKRIRGPVVESRHSSSKEASTGSKSVMDIQRGRSRKNWGWFSEASDKLNRLTGEGGDLSSRTEKKNLPEEKEGVCTKGGRFRFSPNAKCGDTIQDSLGD